jgi:hypothetical protein
MELTTREAQRIFRKLDVEAVESTHHCRGFVVYNGVRILPVFYSRGRKAMPGHVPKKFAKSLRLTLDEFAVLKSCTMTKSEYFDAIRRQGLLDGIEGSSAD